MKEENKNPMEELYEVVKARKETFTEGSYTCYLFEQGLDKILKKCGEECAEMIIASKDLEAKQTMSKSKDNDTVKTAKNELENEMCDLLYHLTVLMAQQDVKLETINNILSERSRKIGNLKKFHETDHNS